MWDATAMARAGRRTSKEDDGPVLAGKDIPQLAKPLRQKRAISGNEASGLNGLDSNPAGHLRNVGKTG
jgi:hypothetical protein